MWPDHLPVRHRSLASGSRSPTMETLTRALRACNLELDVVLLPVDQQLDISFTPSGTEGYKDLRREALRMNIGNGITILVASLLDVIRSKQAAGLARDRAVLPLLREMLDRFGEHP